MENTPNTLDELITLLEQTRTDYNKFYNDGNSACWHSCEKGYRNR